MKYDQEVQRRPIMPMVVALGRLKQNCCKFEVSLELIVPSSFGYMARYCLQTKKEERRWNGEGRERRIWEELRNA